MEKPIIVITSDNFPSQHKLKFADLGFDVEEARNVAALNMMINAHKGHDLLILDSRASIPKDLPIILIRVASILKEQNQNTWSAISVLSDNGHSFTRYPVVDDEFVEPLDLDITNRAAIGSLSLPLEVPYTDAWCVYLNSDILDQVGLLNNKEFKEFSEAITDWELTARHKLKSKPYIIGGFVRAPKTKWNEAKLLAKWPDFLKSSLEWHDHSSHLAQVYRNIDIARLGSQNNVVSIVGVEQGSVASKDSTIKLYVYWEQPTVIHIQSTKSESYKYLPFLELRGTISEAQDIFKRLNIRRVKVESLIGWDSTSVRWFNNLFDSLRVPYEVNIKSYAPICPRLIQVNEKWSWCGLPDDPDQCQFCVDSRGSNYGAVDVVSLRREYKRLLDNATEKRFVSEWHRRAFEIMLPGSDFGNVKPTNSLEDDNVLTEPLVIKEIPSTWRIGIIGVPAFTIADGLSSLCFLLDSAFRRNIPLIVKFFGNMNSIPNIPKNMIDVVPVSDDYSTPKELSKLLLQHKVNAGLVPSLWPEPWSDSLTTFFMAGIPVVGFDIGSVGERLLRSNNGAAIDILFNNDPDKMLDIILDAYQHIINSNNKNE